jgi:hypothetical protein
MGSGPGPGRVIPLSEYQEELGDTVMTVSGGVDYQFVDNHTIPADVEIIFGANDRLFIGNLVDVILEGKLYVIDETYGIERIGVFGTFTMEEGSEIEICGDIINQGAGIRVNNTATYTQNGGDINITNVDGAGSIGIEVNTQFNATTGAINIGSVLNGAQGINVRTAGQFSQSGTNITITNVDGGGSDGIRVNDAGSNFTLSGGSIQISSVTNQGQGIDIINEGTFNQNGLASSITITNVNNAFGIEVIGVNSQFTTSAGTINIDTVTSNAKGIKVINAGQFSQSGSNINITNVVGTGSDGIQVDGNSSVFNALGGTIQINTVTNNAIGLNVRNDGVFTQAGTNITITNVTNSGSGIGLTTTGPGLTATYNQNAGNITFGQLTTNATAIEVGSDTTFTKQSGPTISINIAPTGGGTSGMVVTGTIAGSVVTNLGPNGSIDMTNSDTDYTPALTVADPLVAPWNGVGSVRAFYAPP